MQKVMQIFHYAKVGYAESPLVFLQIEAIKRGTVNLARQWNANLQMFDIIYFYLTTFNKVFCAIICNSI